MDGFTEATQLLQLDSDAFAKALDLPVPETATAVAEPPAPPAPPVEAPPATNPSDEGPAAPGQQRDPETGRFVGKAEAEVPPAEPAAEPAAKPPLTKFEVIGAEFDPTQVQLRFKVDGKDEQEPLEKVVHRAQQQKFLARQAQELTEKSKEFQGKLEAVEAEKGQLEQYYAKLFEDPEFFDKARTAYLHAQSPEQRAVRAEAEARQIREQSKQQQEAEHAARFMANEVMPSLQSLVADSEGVTEDYLLGQLAMAIPQFVEQGRVPLHRLPELKQWVDTALAEKASAARTRFRSVIDNATKATREAQAAAQAAQRQAAKAMAPVGGAVPKASPETRVVKADDIFKDPLFGGQG